MSKRNNNENENDEENLFHETEDDPYAIPSVDKYDSDPSSSSPYSNDVDTDTNLSKFIEDKWNNDDKSDNNSKTVSANTPKQIKSKEDLTIELGTAGICGLLFMRNFVEGGMVGMAFGGIKGIINGYQMGTNKLPGFARTVYAEAAVNGRSLGLWLGTYRASKVFFLRTRQTDDSLNTFMAGFCAGSMYMLHTRSPVQIITSGLSSGAMLSVLASFGGSSL